MSVQIDLFGPIPLDVEKALRENPEVRAEYDRLGPEFERLKSSLNRKRAGKESEGLGDGRENAS